MGTENRAAIRRPFASLRALCAVGLVVLSLILSAIPVSAQDSADDGESSDEIEPTVPVGSAGFVDVIEVNGLIDPVMVDFISGALSDSEAGGAVGVVLQMESAGAAIDDESIDELANQIAELDVPVSVWLGQANNGEAMGRAGQLALASSRIGISPGSEFGDFGEMILTGSAAEAQFVEVFASGFTGGVFTYDDIVGVEGEDGVFEGGLLQTNPELPLQDAPLVLNHLLELDGFRFDLLSAGDALPDGTIIPEGAEATRVPVTQSRFVTLPLIDQQFHTFASPPVAYLLFIIGLGLLVFELFTAGVGVAGVLGAGSFLAGAYGLSVLDARWWAVLLLVIAFIGFAIDVQSGIQAFWSAVGVAFLIIGSLFLLGEHSIGWLPLGVGIIGMLLAMLGGMPAMVRTRFSTPTIGREWMIGETGEVSSDVDPDGVVMLRGAPWRARTNRATPILAGERARVVEIDGLLLEVEPESGGAIDYRERRRIEDEHAALDEAEAAAANESSV